MKSILISLFLILPCLLISQQQLDAELSDKLEGKQKFQEIKTTILDHYQKNDKQSKFWNRHFWMAENYMDADGNSVAKSKVDYQGLTSEIKKRKVNSQRGQPTPWTLEGPTYVEDGGGIGRVDVLAFHPTSPNIIFAGSPHGGLFKSFNGGVNWFPIGDMLASVGVAGIAIDPTNADIIYVLSGNADGGGLVTRYGYLLPSLGVFKTTDGGENWDLLTLPENEQYTGRDLIIDPSNPNVLLVATSKGIFRTTNGGQDWSKSSGWNANDNHWDLEFHPTNSSIVYSTLDGFFVRSLDNGLSFQYPQGNTLSPGRIAIGTTINNPAKVYLFAGYPKEYVDNGFQGFFMSNNEGSSFTLMANTPNLFASFGTFQDFTSNQSSYNIAIAVSPLNDQVIYVGGLSCWKSVDGGVNWDQISSYSSMGAGLTYLHPDIHALAFNPLSMKLFCGNDGGVYERFYPAGGGTEYWQPRINGLSIATFYHFEYANDEGDLWGGCQDNGILERSSGGLFMEYAGGDGYDMMTDHPYLVDNGEADDIYYTVNDIVYKDCGMVVDCDITPIDNTEFFGNLAMSPTDEDKIYVGYQQGLYRSLNAGDDWLFLGNKPANWAVSSCQTSDNVVYHSGTNNNATGIFKYIAGFTSSSDRTPGLTSVGYTLGLKITDIDVSLSDHNIVYLSVAGTSANSKVFKTTNGGILWENLSFDLPNVPMFSIKSDDSGGIYVGTSIGVYYKRNGINNWEYFGNGLPPVPVTEIELDPIIGLPYIYVSTFGRGIWKTVIYDQTCVISKNLLGDVEGIQYHEASEQINSSQTISANPGTNIKYNSGGRIFLTPGFLAKQGTIFKTYNTGCGGVTGG